MRTATIQNFEENLSQYMHSVEQGEALVVCKRNVPIARVIPWSTKSVINRTILGCGLGTVQIHGDLTEPLIPEEQWTMHMP